MSTVRNLNDGDISFTQQALARSSTGTLDYRNVGFGTVSEHLPKGAGIKSYRKGGSTVTYRDPSSGQMLTRSVNDILGSSTPQSPSTRSSLSSNIGSGFKSVTTSRTPESQTSAGRLDKMLASNSPLMQRAATQGKQIASQRGLLNSSMAAGASQGAMIDRAQPFALQDSNNMYRENQFNANAQNQFSLQHNDFLGRSQLAEQGYRNQTGLNQQQYGFDMNRLQASSTANAWGVMSNNITDIVAQSMDAINNIQSNSNITADNKASMIEQILDMRDTDIAFQSSLYESLSDYLADTGLFPNL